MGYERIFVVENDCVEGIAGVDGFFESPLKFTDEGSIKDSRSPEFHEIEEMVFVVSEFPLHNREIRTTVMNIVWGKSGNF